ncbi:hypothetical protein [Flavihumibacter fluvii]|uniref:hypothetical protein n=1 Tax=Flavihumibacter fluvii TaxID=2838157 RepID=UPI001BDDEFC9|nr:hypothetical protein [Flavihumibacter fluvii]ULQ52832.1 hypothetical protein KJS93_00665 [Flavihumibacter fluvii]
MKTSNRILLGLITILVLLPVLMLWGFRNKIATNDFTVEKYGWSVNSNKEMPLTASRFIKLQAPDSTDMHCQLMFGGNDHYQLNRYDTDDSLAVIQVADTLFFRFIPAAREVGNHENPELYFNLYLSAAPPIFADGVDISVDSMGRADSLQVHLVNNSSIDLGNDVSRDKQIQYGNISVTADNSKITLYPKLNMQSLNVTLTGNASLDIDKEAKIGKVSGTVSPNAMVNGPASYMYQLLFDHN